MVFFKAFDKELIDYNSWKSREQEDEDWKQFIIKLMEKHKVPIEHIDIVRKENVMFRFKPEEVVSSALRYPRNLTVDYDYCVPQGTKIKSILKPVQV